MQVGFPLMVGRPINMVAEFKLFISGGGVWDGSTYVSWCYIL